MIGCGHTVHTHSAQMLSPHKLLLFHAQSPCSRPIRMHPPIYPPTHTIHGHTHYTHSHPLPHTRAHIHLHPPRPPCRTRPAPATVWATHPPTHLHDRVGKTPCLVALAGIASLQLMASPCLRTSPSVCTRPLHSPAFSPLLSHAGRIPTVALVDWRRWPHVAELAVGSTCSTSWLTAASEPQCSWTNPPCSLSCRSSSSCNLPAHEHHPRGRVNVAKAHARSHSHTRRQTPARLEFGNEDKELVLLMKPPFD